MKTISVSLCTGNFDPLVGISYGPDVHHHVHTSGGKVVVIGTPGQTYHFSVMPVELALDLRTHNTCTAVYGVWVISS